MESRTLLRLRGDVRYLGDAESLTLRHPDADLNRRINASLRALRALVTARGGAFFITSTTVSLASSQVSGENFSEIAWPATAVSITGVDIESVSGAADWRSLRPIAWSQRRYPWYSGAPQYFAVRLLPEGSETATTAGVITLWPAATTGNAKVWYLPDFVELDEDDDVFLGLPDWHDWVVWSVVQDLAARDDDQRETYAIASAKKAEAEGRIVEALGRVQAAGPLRPRRSYWRRGR